MPGACAVCAAPGATLRCGRCKKVGLSVFYCDAKCQRADWKKHKKVCGTKTSKSKKKDAPPEPPTPEYPSHVLASARDKVEALESRVGKVTRLFAHDFPGGDTAEPGVLDAMRQLFLTKFMAQWDGAAEIRQGADQQISLHATRDCEAGEVLMLERAMSHPVKASMHALMSAETISHVEMGYGIVLSGSLGDITGTILALTLLHPLRRARLVTCAASSAAPRLPAALLAVPTPPTPPVRAHAFVFVCDAATGRMHTARAVLLPRPQPFSRRWSR